ncbi:MAG: restriction endonuclease subunit S [Bacteroidetes bacterium]|nr:restriction endonuclease subunit S [Bacteroidota bacterium]
MVNWETKRLGDGVLKIGHGKNQHEIEKTNGKYPILATSGKIGHTDSFLYDKPSVLIGRKGTIDKPQYMDTPFWTIDTLFYSIVSEDHSAKYLYYLFCTIDWNKHNEASGVPSLSTKVIEDIEVALPPLPEQRRIAAVLSDTDELIATLEKLIAKKRAIKQGAMQELLTGKRRLPGFSGKWMERKLGNIVEVFDNLRIPVAESLREDGLIPYYGANGIQDYVKGYTHDGEFVLLAEDGANDLQNYPVNYVYSKVWVNNHAHVISGISGVTNTKYLSYALRTIDFQSILVGGTRAKLNGSVMRGIDITLPKDIKEQTAIASILSDMDAEIDTLTAKLNKLRNIKQGMMSELLTGRIRLLEQEMR